MNSLAELQTERDALGMMTAEELGAVASDYEDMAAHHQATADRYARQARIVRQEQARRSGRIQ